MTPNGNAIAWIQEDYLREFIRVHPHSNPPTITSAGSWYRVVWNDGSGRKTCRAAEIVRMTSVLRGMEPK